MFQKFGIRARAGILKPEAGAELDSKNYDSAHVWILLLLDQRVLTADQEFGSAKE